MLLLLGLFVAALVPVSLLFDCLISYRHAIPEVLIKELLIALVTSVIVITLLLNVVLDNSNPYATGDVQQMSAISLEPVEVFFNSDDIETKSVIVFKNNKGVLFLIAVGDINSKYFKDGKLVDQSYNIYVPSSSSLTKWLLYNVRSSTELEVLQGVN